VVAVSCMLVMQQLRTGTFRPDLITSNMATAAMFLLMFLITFFMIFFYDFFL
jgi:hypothetical protein